MTLNYPEATEDALRVLRSGLMFEWYVVPVAFGVVYLYVDAWQKGSRKGFAASLALVLLFWSWQIGNGLFQHVAGHALWTVPGDTALLLLVGTPIEMVATVAAAGLLLMSLLPDDPRAAHGRINNRLVFTVTGAASFAALEGLVARSTAFVWIYPWWGGLSAFLLVYMPIFTVAIYCYDWKPIRQVRLIGGLVAVNLAAMLILGAWLHWI